MSISAIVPVFNGRDLLARLLDSLDAQTEKAAEVLVIDNGSTDGAPALALRRGARVIPMGRNAGFAAAVNRGIRESRGHWIAILNSDVELAPDYFAILTRSDAWFATGLILNSTGDLIDGTCDLVCRGGTAWRAGSGRPGSSLFREQRVITSPPWTAALFRADLFDRTGLLDESFESYLEDVDFGLRCAARQITGLYVPEAVAHHRGSATWGKWHPKMVRLISRNQILILARHYPRRLLLSCLWPVLVAQILWGALALRHGTFLAWLVGKWQGLRLFSTARAKSQSDTGLLAHLRDNEERIRRLQSAAGFDAYWRLYFLLTRGRAT